MNKPLHIALIVIVLVLIGGWYWSPLPRFASPALLVNDSTITPTSEAETPSGAPTTAAITYTATGFSPGIVTIKQGGIVTFTNENGGPMWVAADAHPSHILYDGTNRAEHCPDTAGTAFDQCATSLSYSFTFQKIGSWKYHNHVNAADGGTVIVVP